MFASDRTVIPDRTGVGMNVINVDLLPEPYPRGDSDAPKSMQRRPHAAAARCHVRDLLQESLDDIPPEHDPNER